MMTQVDKNGVPYFSEEDLIKIMYTDNLAALKKIRCVSDDGTLLFNYYNEEFKLNIVDLDTLEEDMNSLDQKMLNDWLMPEEFKSIDVDDLLHSMVTTEIEKNRITEELAEFKQRGLYNLLRYMVYLVYIMRKNNIVWGVGRGSSVSSYVLYLIGIHRINPLTHNLDWREFLR
jgi:DNA polymerase III alpha subunit